MTSNGNGLTFKSVKILLSNEVRGNLVKLPSSIVQVLESTPIPVQEYGIEISTNGSRFLAGWDGFESSQTINGHAVVQINPVLAAANKVRDGELVEVKVKHYSNEHVAKEVYIEPQSSDDWEIIEANARFFQDDMLHQTRMVAKDKLLICYVEKTVARFKVQKIIPESLNVARLDTETLVVVSPMQNEARLLKGKQKKHADPLPTFAPITLRTTRHSDSLDSFSIAVRHSLSRLALVSIIENPIEAQASKKSEEEGAVAFAKKIAVKVVTQSSFSGSEVALSHRVWDSLGLSPTNGEKVKVEFISDPETTASPTVFIHPVKSSSAEKSIILNDCQTPIDSSLQASLQTFLDKCVLTDKLFIPEARVFVELIGDNGEHVPFYDWEGEEMKVKVLDTSVKIQQKAPVSSNAIVRPRESIGLESLVHDIVSYLTLPVIPSGIALITGGSGMGKTLLVQEVAFHLQQTTSLSIVYFDCESHIDNTNFAKTRQLLHNLIYNGYWHGPSILILDNADVLFPSTRSEEEVPSSSTSADVSSRLCQVFMLEVAKIAAKSSKMVRVLMTARGKDHINQVLFSMHAVGKIWSLKPPSKSQRHDMFRHFITTRNLTLSDDLDESTMALETEGYSSRDMLLFCDKLLCEHICDNEVDSTLRKSTFERANSTFTPSSLQGIKLQKDTGVKWESVGAMHKAKNLLLETLEWPTKYAPIFAKCPLRLRSGILLYGYPGCGKTMLASAVAQQCGLNFISIKGPEILNKYIGASEQSIREVFERAQAAKPCILFFDEFDSIAPKRGHDSIGVTDRVVNQMLTQMDGAEGLDGVYVLAATSRPDLIDSALLRPGRLDKSILCGLPNEEERLEILQAVVASGGMHLEPSCQLDRISEATHGMSGADLQGLCYNAFLKAVHRNMASALDNTEQNKASPQEFEYFKVANTDSLTAVHFMDLLKQKLGNSNDNTTNSSESLQPPTITLQDFLQASTETKASISASEYQKLTAIYNTFSQDRDANMPAGEASNEVGGRLTLM